MNYFLDLFSPETAAKFSSSDQTVSGFRIRHRKAARRIQRGDILVCYLTRLSRWVGLLEITGDVYEDSSPRFTEQADPFVVRFPVRPIVWLPPEQGIPIHDEALWDQLSFTRKHAQDSSTWTGFVRSSLVRLQDSDAQLLDRMLREQAQSPRPYPLDADERKALQLHIVRRSDKEIPVTIPEVQPDHPALLVKPPEARESTQIQALLASIGTRMRVPRDREHADRRIVIAEIGAS